MAGLVLVLGLAGAGVAWSIWYFSEAQRQRRLLRSAPLMLPADAGHGQVVRVVGVARALADGALESPLSASPCVAWGVVVEERVQAGDYSNWKQVLEQWMGQSFELDVHGTRVPVDVAASTVPIVVLDKHYKSDWFFGTHPRLEAFLREHGQSGTRRGWLFNSTRTLRYREGIVAPGERVVVRGEAHWEEDPNPAAPSPADGHNYRENARPKRLVLRAPSDGTPMIVSDVPGLVS